MKKTIITEKMVLAAAVSNSQIVLPKHAIITPLAKDTAKSKGVKFVTESNSPSSEAKQTPSLHSPIKKIAIGSDHGGFNYKQELIPFIQSLGFEIVDVGTDSEKAVDYPDFAYAVGRLIQSHQVDIGIMIDGAGIGSAMALNKMSGILAACCYNEFTARNAREHNHANVLTLGSKGLGTETCKTIIQTFVTVQPDMGRHLNRVNKIRDIEQKFSGS